MMEKTLFGQNIEVKTRLPYKTKVEAAEELAAMLVVFNEEAGICYDNYLRNEYKIYIALKYYTNVDMGKYAGEDWIFDLMDDVEKDKDNYNEVFDAITFDAETIFDLAWKLADNAKTVFEHQHSLSTRIMQSFSFLLDGRDLTETLAQAREINEQMIDHMGEIAKAKTVDLAQYAKKKK